MNTEFLVQTEAEIFGRKIIAFQEALGGVVTPCDSCPFKDIEILCGQEEGIQFSSDGNPMCPIKPNQTVYLKIE